MAKRFLVPVDGSAQQEKVVAAAIQQTRSAEDELLLYRVVEFPENLLMLPNYKAVVAKTESYVKDELEAVKSQLLQDHPQLKVTVLVEHGKGKQKIATFCRDHELSLDLVIMGVTGESAGNLTGSTTAYVVNHAPCNVLVVK